MRISGAALTASIIGLSSKMNMGGAEAAPNNGGAFDFVDEEAAPQSPLTLWYSRPSGQWLEALPIGNGRLGAMVFGGVDNETIQLNESTIWSGGPHNYDNPNALAALPQIRQLIFDEKWHDAENLINNTFLGNPHGQAAYQTVGNLRLAFAAPKVVGKYQRALDLENAISTTSYIADGKRIKREVFSSAPDQVIVMRLTADGDDSVSFKASFDSPQKVDVQVRTDRAELVAVKNNSGQVNFAVITKFLLEGGSLNLDGSSVNVSGAKAVTILISIGSSYKNYNDVSGDSLEIATRHLDSAAKKSYDALRNAHIADHKALFDRFSIDLGHSDAEKKTTNVRISEFVNDADPALAALYCQYGRYLTIAGSRPGGQPTTLQGLWNDSLRPAWDSKYTININTEMNYWPPGPGNLLECYEPLFGLISDLSVTGAKTAKTQYGARGWVAHHNTDGWRGTAPVDGAGFGMWPSGGAWLCKSIWDYYEFSQDKEALRKWYPLMKGSAQFFLDALVEDPKTKYLVTNPSMSPENPHHNGVSDCYAPTMDNQILRDLFDASAEASEILGIDADFRKDVKAARARLAPMKIGATGLLQEWLEDWDMQEPDPHNRHVSHLYGLYPSQQITRLDTPDLFVAARKSLERRGDEATGWGTAWRINFWARLEDGNRAYKLVKDLIQPSHTAANMFDLHPPFQIDGNYGGSAGIMEMLVQSRIDDLHLLPALPSLWPNGHVRGLLARGGISVDLEWANGALTHVRLLARKNVVVNARYGSVTKKLSLRAGKAVVLNGKLEKA
jgi:alpha-L-fucosidase 2